MNAVVLITGCNGYVGSHLVPFLKEKWAKSTLVGVGKRAKPESLIKGLDHYYSIDLCSKSSVENLIATVQPNIIIHLASQRFGSLQDLLDNNVVATDHLLEAVRRLRGPEKQIILIGSSAEIGYCSPNDLPLTEHFLCQPVDPYGISKLAQSTLAKAAYLRYNQNIVRLRLFNLIGPGLPSTLLSGRCVQLLAAIAANKEPKTVLKFGDLSTQRDYIDVRDVCYAILLAMKSNHSGKLYHIGSGKMTSGQALIELLIAESGLDVQYQSQPMNPNTFSVPAQAADLSLVRKKLSWTPTISLKDSVSDMWKSRNVYY